MDEIELGSCDFCARVGRKRNLARVTWLINGQYNEYCPHCLDKVLRDMMTLPWHREHGYEIEYPWRDEK